MNKSIIIACSFVVLSVSSVYAAAPYRFLPGARAEDKGGYYGYAGYGYPSVEGLVGKFKAIQEKQMKTHLQKTSSLQ